jgi:hypothetical protein
MMTAIAIPPAMHDFQLYDRALMAARHFLQEADVLLAPAAVRSSTGTRERLVAGQGTRHPGLGRQLAGQKRDVRHLRNLRAVRQIWP